MSSDGPPNLDCMSEDEVLATALVFDQLAQYARHKGYAMTHRRNGHIDIALRYEAELDRMYRQLPDWARW